jgi:hypothetical protein
VSVLYITNTGEGSDTAGCSSSIGFRGTSAAWLFVLTDFMDKEHNNRNIDRWKDSIASV